MKSEVRDFRPDDYTAIARRRFDLITYGEFSDPGKIAKQVSRGPSFTGLVDGQIVACGGVLPLWKGVAEAWMVTSALAEKYPLFFAKTVARELTRLIRDLGLVRVQCVVDLEHTVSQAWVERMGFRKEGIMKRYLADRDYYRYARVKGT